MQIFVKTLTGKILVIAVESNETVSSVKDKIHEKEGLPPVSQRIGFNRKVLEDDNTLADYNVQEGSTLHLLPHLKR